MIKTIRAHFSLFAATAVLLLGSGLPLMIYFSLLMLLLAGLALTRRSIGSPVSVPEQADFVSMARSAPAVLELDPRAESIDDTGGSGG